MRGTSICDIGIKDDQNNDPHNGYYTSQQLII